MELNEKTLTPIAIAFLGIVRQHWPDFIEYAASTDDGALIVEYPSPHTVHASILGISTDVYLDEIIVTFGSGHSHRGQWDNPEDSDYRFDSTAHLINAILNENVVGCQMKNGAGGLLHFEKLPDSSLIRSVRSWRGTHDMDCK